MDKAHPGYGVLRRYPGVQAFVTLSGLMRHLRSEGASENEVHLALGAIGSGPKDLADGLTRVLRERGHEE